MAEPESRLSLDQVERHLCELAVWCDQYGPELEDPVRLPIGILTRSILIDVQALQLLLAVARC